MALEVKPKTDPFGTLRHKSDSKPVGELSAGNDLEVGKFSISFRDQDENGLHPALLGQAGDPADYVLLRATPKDRGNCIQIGWSKERFCEEVLRLSARDKEIRSYLLFELMKNYSTEKLEQLYAKGPN